jgi:outer membrane protein
MMTLKTKQNHSSLEWVQIFNITYDKGLNMMIRKFSVILLSMFLLLPLSVSAEMEIFKIGYVVVEKVLKQAPQTAASNKKLEKEFKSRTDELQKKVKAIQKQEKDFNKNSVTMSAAERQKAQKKIQNSKIEIQRIERELREDIDIRRREEIGKLQQKINEAIEEMAKTDKFDLILYQGVAYASKEIDITDKLIKVLGKAK